MSKPSSDKIITYPKVMVTGHRPFDLTEEQITKGNQLLLKVAKRLRDSYGMTEAISGMALGADTVWAKIALSLNVDLAAYIPFPQQPNKWSEKDKRVWERLRSSAARERVFSDTFAMKWLFVRNSEMIKDSDLTIAVLDPDRTKGGTVSAVAEARRLNQPLIIIDLKSFEVRTENFR